MEWDEKFPLYYCWKMMKLCCEMSAGLLFGGNIGCEHQCISFEMVYVQIGRNWKNNIMIKV